MLWSMFGRCLVTRVQHPRAFKWRSSAVTWCISVSSVFQWETASFLKNFVVYIRIPSSWRSGNLLCAGVFIMRAGEFCAGRPERPPVSQDRRQTTHFQVDEEVSIEEKLMGLAPMSTKPKKKMLNVDCNAQPLDLVGVCCRFRDWQKWFGLMQKHVEASDLCFHFTYLTAKRNEGK